MKKIAPVIALLFALTLFGVGLGGCSDSGQTTNPVQSLKVDELDRMITAKDFSGLVTAVASWCPPCREELPELTKLNNKYQTQGVQIIAISLDADGPKAIQPLIDELKVTFPVYWVGQKAITRFKIIGVPTMMVVKNGQMLEKIPGKLSRSEMEKKIKAVLDTNP